MKKVCFIFHDTSLNNGAVHSMMDIIDNLETNIIPILLFPKFKGSAIDYSQEKKYKYYCLRYGTWSYSINNRSLIYLIKWWIKNILTFINLKKLLKILKTEKIDLIYTNTYTIYLGCILKKILKIKHIWHIREFGYEDHELKLIFGEKLFYRCLNNYTDKIIFISNSVKEKYISNIIDKNKVIVLYNDINNNIKINNEIKWNNTSPVNILISGTFQRKKGQLDVLMSVDELLKKYKESNFRLYIVGKKQGKYYETLNNYVINNKLNKNVIFTDYVINMDKLRSIMHISITSSYNEAFGRVTVEGMLSNCCVIGANSAGTSEIITDLKNGYLYSNGNFYELAEILNYLIKNPSTMQKIAKNGHSFAKSKFSKQKTSQEILKIINNL